MSGIPTMYRGVLMRSRLEARWAAMFDAMRWPWRYEPIDLSGYIPDFVLDLRRPLLVEVKPTLHCAEAYQKIERSGWSGEALVVGDSVGAQSLGRFGALEDGPDGPQLVWGDAHAFFCISCGSVSVLPEHADWTCRVCGDGHGNAHVGEYDPVPAWLAAGNRVQWRAA